MKSVTDNEVITNIVKQKLKFKITHPAVSFKNEWDTLSDIEIFWNSDYFLATHSK